MIVFQYGQVYTLTCTAVDSRPDVSLSIFDSDTLNDLSYNNPNVFSNSSCDSSTQLCTSFLQISFSLDLTNNLFDNMKALTCLAKSKNNEIELSIQQTRKVLVILPTTTKSTSTKTTTSSSSTSTNEVTTETTTG